jgi:cbb3-type cytochrome oxidase subunit 3
MPNEQEDSRQESKAAKHGVLGKYAYAWITLAFFLGSLALHWWFGWQAYVDEAREHGHAPESAGYLAEMLRDTFENWQSEFLQLLWQVLGLAYFLYLGSPSSKENDDRVEAKIDELIKLQAGKKGEEIIDRLDDIYLRHHGHARPHGH